MGIEVCLVVEKDCFLGEEVHREKEFCLLEEVHQGKEVLLLEEVHKKIFQERRDY